MEYPNYPKYISDIYFLIFSQFHTFLYILKHERKSIENMFKHLERFDNSEKMYTKMLCCTFLNCAIELFEQYVSLNLIFIYNFIKTPGGHNHIIKFLLKVI